MKKCGFAGIIGARLYYVLFNFSYYSAHAGEILQVWKGGLAIHGALIGGAGAYFLFVWRRKIPALLYADIMVPGILFAQALGRWGNFFNNEAFGRPTSLPWKLFIPEQFRPSQYADFSYFHPAFLYESIWNFVGVAVLVWMLRGTRKNGKIFFLYLIWYSFGRFFIESLRTDSLYFGQLRAAQLASAVLFLGGILGLLILRKKTIIKPLNKP